MSESLKEVMNKQYNIQAIIDIVRTTDDFEFEKRLYKLRICYIRRANILFTLQQIENEIKQVNRGLIILNQNKNNNSITDIINIYYKIKLLENKEKNSIKYKKLDNDLKNCILYISEYITPDILRNLQHIRKELLDIINDIKSI